MSDIAVRVEHLGKLYHIGQGKKARYETLSERITGIAQAPVRSIQAVLRGQSSAVPTDTIWALKDVSFEVKHGEVVGIIGRNGAGKSTLLKILSQITEPTEGCIDIYGRVGALLEVGTGFHPELTGRENVYLNGAILGMRRHEIDRKFEEIVDFSGVEKFIDTPVKHYSSGMQVRLAFSVAAHLEPEILIVDEVLAVGDAEFQKKCLGKMGDVTQEGRTVLFVSHNMAAVQNLCSRAMLLHESHIAADGLTQAVIDTYVKKTEATSVSLLVDRKDRQGTGAVRFVSVVFQNEDGERVSFFTCGQKAVFVLFYENQQEHGIRNFRIDIGVNNYMDYRITWLSNYAIDNVFDVVPAGKNCIKVSIDRLPLMPGRYSLTLHATVSGVIVDWIKNAAFFTVEAGDFYQTGKLPPPDQGDFLMDYGFSVDSDAE
jgi:lipopolysaccharide transport system ATP-binding protein